MRSRHYRGTCNRCDENSGKINKMWKNSREEEFHRIRKVGSLESKKKSGLTGSILFTSCKFLTLQAYLVLFHPSILR